MRRIFFLTVIMCLAVLPTLAQDPVEVDPGRYKVEFENDQVRVLRVRYGPHYKGKLHEHPAGVVIWLTDAEVRTTSYDGKTEELHPKAGETFWSGPAKHWGENLSDKAFEVIRVDIKGKSTRAGHKPN